MSKPNPKEPPETEDPEIAKRRDAMLLRALKTPPQPRPKRDRSKGKPEG